MGERLLGKVKSVILAFYFFKYFLNFQKKLKIPQNNRKSLDVALFL